MKLTRENRYEELTGFRVPHRDGSGFVPEVTVLRCRSCGSLLLPGDEDIHERMHPLVSCDHAHPRYSIYHSERHCWEEQFKEE